LQDRDYKEEILNLKQELKGELWIITRT
jgi:hypothetical protein